MKKLLLLIALAAVMTAGCEDMKSRRYVVVHHKNIHDTVTTSSYTFYYDVKSVSMKEGGCFTQVEYVKCIGEPE